MTLSKKVILSGVQPSGLLHLGNYLGSIATWVMMQKSDAKNDYMFGIMDLHSITVAQDPIALRESVLSCVRTYLACGLDVEKSIIFRQSDVSAHLELAWVLSCIAPLGWLNRMTQFKDKSAKSGEVNAGLGLYSYPVLMASDILIYKADLVPVGSDQKQHLEFCRDLAVAFNSRFGVNYFKQPEPFTLDVTKRIMSLQDGSKKMSKSDPSDLSRINLDDSAEVIAKKVKKAKTDSSGLIEYDENRKELANLLNIFSALTSESVQDIAKRYRDLGNAKFKSDLADAIISKLSPIQHELVRLKKDDGFVKSVMLSGAKRAQEIALKTRDEVFSIVGLR